jgi:hypothetical protein
VYGLESVPAGTVGPVGGHGGQQFHGPQVVLLVYAGEGGVRERP